MSERGQKNLNFNFFLSYILSSFVQTNCKPKGYSKVIIISNQGTESTMLVIIDKRDNRMIIIDSLLEVNTGQGPSHNQ